VAAHVKIAVLVGSLLAALLAAVVLRLRNRTYRRLDEAEVAAQDSERNSP
jgi:NhaA family Na+:H+ antiporter